MNATILNVMVLGLFIISTSAMADVKKTTSSTTTTTTVTQAAAAPDSAMMERMKEYMTLNENHELLKSFAGVWKTESKMWMAPNTQPETSQGTSDNRMILNGHYLEQNFTGTAMGGPYEGRGIMGYDNMKKEFTTLWFDNMGTGIMKGSSKYDPATKTFTETGTMSCPVSNETNRWYKSVITLIDADHYKYESYMKDEKGQEFKGMEVNYTRAQS
jgi:hypothetical protein